MTSLNKGILKKLKTRCLEKASGVTVVSDHLKKVVENITVHKIRTLSVIPMGVNAAKFGKRYYVDNYFGQGKKKVVLFVGRLAEKKGISYLIEAMRDIDAILEIVGDGPLRCSLKEQAKEQGEKIRFLGAKTHDELKTIYASADVLVVPSVTANDGDQEGLGLVILEAMASETPVVASRSGGIVQLIENEINGLLCEEKNVEQLGKNINRLLTDRELCEQIAKNMKKTVNQYDYGTIAKKYTEEMQWIL